MNSKSLARQYNKLTPQERFRLILAAGARGDRAEQDRLANAGQRLTLSMKDHAPYGHAFDDIDLLTFLELLEHAADYCDALQQADDVAMLEECEAGEGPEDSAAEDPGADAANAAAARSRECEAGEGPEDSAAEDPGAAAANAAAARSMAERWLDVVQAKAFTLKSKADGWKLFCERLSVPPFATWEGLPGFGRLQRALALAEGAAFVPEEMVRWLNSIRPEGEPEAAAEELMSPEKLADELAELFRDRVRWWGGAGG